MVSRKGVFQQFSVNFLTNESSKAAPAGLDPTSFRFTIHYSTTAPHSPYENLCDSTIFLFSQYLFTFVSTVFSFVSTVLTFVSTVLTFVSTVFSFVSTLLTFVSTLFFFPQYGVKLHQYYVFFVSTQFIYPSILCFTSSVLC